MTPRALPSQLAVTLTTASAGVLAEAGLAAARAATPATAAASAVWALGLWALPAALAAFSAAWLLAQLCEEGSLGARVATALGEPSQRAGLVVALAACSLLGGWVFVCARALAGLHNRELSAALLSLATLLGALILAALAHAGWRWLRRRPAWRASLAGSLALGLAVWGAIALECRSGLQQLDPRLWIAPIVCVATFALADRVSALRAMARRVSGAALVVLLLAWVGFLFAPSRAGATLSAQGAWSRLLVAGLQRASDFDGDGYSSLLGGGDCAPFDAAVNPGAAEIPGDGVDNNCIGGDAGRAAAPRRPSWGPSAHGSPAGLNLVVITIETLRRDHASFVNARNDTTPTLRALASSALVFERMYSAAPYTRLALASLFSSYAPSEIDWQPQPEKHMRHIAPSVPWLPELLRDRGYDTIAVLTDFSAFTPAEAIGFERGFRHYDISTKLEYRGGTMWGFPAAAEVDRALEHLARAERPFLLWLHLFEPHFRYEQPPGAPVFGADSQSRYDAEIWHVDHELARLFAGLRALGVWDSTVLFVSGDHGEAFGEHDDRWHGTNLFDPQLRPAALLRVPGINGKRVAESVTFTDIAPTLARVLGERQVFDQLRGRSLAPLLHHPALPEGEQGFVAETFNIEDGRDYEAALVAYPFKLIFSAREHRFSFYDLATDPGETRGVDANADPHAQPLLTDLVAYLERARPRTLGAREDDR